MRKIKKNLLLLSLLGLLSFSTSGQNQMNNIVKITPVGFLKGQSPMVHYERVIYEKLTASIGVASIYTSPLIGSLAFPVDEFKGGIAIDPEIRWYAKSDKVMDGFFVGLFGSNRVSSWNASETAGTLFGDSNISVPNLNVTATRRIGGIQIGTQKLVGEHFSVDVFGGLGFSGSRTIAKVENTNKVFDEVVSGGVNFRLNFSLGWRF
jgi:hypothetical protein